MVIVEGPDGSGKTTLVNQLSEVLGLTPEPRRVSKDMEALVPLGETIEKDMDTWPRKALYDRHGLLSEAVYAPLFRDIPHPGLDYIEPLKYNYIKFQQSHPTIIYCLPKLETVIANTDNDPDNIRASSKIASVYWAYYFQAARDTDSIVWDYEDNFWDLDGLVLYIKNYQRNWNGLLY